MLEFTKMKIEIDFLHLNLNTLLFVFQVSLDNYKALKFFFKFYSEYKDRDFYITGESYGGIYVPTLAERVVEDSEINFKVKNVIDKQRTDSIIKQTNNFFLSINNLSLI